jgi:hypothetical protein
MDIKLGEFLWKDEGSNVTNCPSLSRAQRNGQEGYVVNGAVLDAAMQSQIPHAGNGEVAVFVPANVIDRIRDLG